MAKYLMLKHYRGAPAAVNDVPMNEWTPQEIDDHVQYMNDFAARLEGTGEYVDSQALSPEGTFVRYDGAGRPPVTDGPLAESQELIARWVGVDGAPHQRAPPPPPPGRPRRRRGAACPRPRARGGSRSTSGSSYARSWAHRRP